MRNRFASLLLYVFAGFVACTPTPAPRLNVRMLYPIESSTITMGQAVKFSANVTDAQGNSVNAQVNISIHEPDGKLIATLSAPPYYENAYRTDSWLVPHRSTAGTWSIQVHAQTDRAQGDAAGKFQIENSTSETLLNKYGFWLDAPTLRGISPLLVAEKGDYHNGLIRWGGQIPGGHLLVSNWVDVQWREGKFDLSDAASVRRFMLEQLGDLGFTPIRELGPFEPAQFKTWRAWRVGARGQVKQDQVEWMVFYVPEVNKTMALGTTVVLPPANIDAHAVLRESFAIDPSIHANGIAPEPLPQLLPAPELLAPPLDARFVGMDQPIVLRWKAARNLTPDEYYEVSVDYNYREANPTIKFATRETQIVLPENLYHTPNCQVFNWRVTLKRQTGTQPDGEPIGDALSYDSLYWYVRWSYPPDAPPPFPPACPNEQT